MVYLRNLALALALSLCFFSSNAQTITNHQFTDDSYVQVPLQFPFPFYGKVFTNSWMHSNGVVGFMDPRTTAGAAQWAYCCEGLNASQLTPEFNYMIAPLWTDLYPVAISRFTSEGTTAYQRYRWENIAEISNQANLNTFSVEIRPTGFIGVNYELINITNQNVFAGTVGDVALGEYKQVYQGLGIPSGVLPNWSLDSTGFDMCLANPLSSPTCSGYQEAYTLQQCTINPLYSTACPGYAEAYLNEQCTINPLYSTMCIGYAEAYKQKLFADACSANPQSSVKCSGYVAPTENSTTSITTSVDGKVSDPTVIQTISDPVVNSIVSTPSVISVTSVTSTIVQSAPPSTTPLQQSISDTSTKTDSKAESKDTPAPAPSPRQAAAREAARQEAVKKGKDLANEMGESVSMKDQVARQDLIAAAMGYNAGFDSYQSVIMRDSQFYKPYEIYKTQVNVDNRRALHGLQSDSVHKEMIDSQYRGK